MLSHSLRGWFSLSAIAALVFLNSCGGLAPSQTSLMGTLYEQPVDPNGKLLLSSWLEPDGSDFDQYIWDNFTLTSDETITDISWFGVYDPLKFGAGGPVVDFSLSIYPSIAAGTEPAVANPPLVQYQTGGNAGEAAVGTVGTTTLYAYTFSLPAPFTASADAKYWVQIEASQHGSIPDWCLAPGSGGDGSYYRKGSGIGGDVIYRFGPGDAAFTLLGPMPATATSTDTPIVSSSATQTSTDTPTITPTDTPTNTLTYTATNTSTATETPANTPTDTPSPTPSYTLTATATFSPTPSETLTSTPTDTATETPTASQIFADTPTTTATPVFSTPVKVTGGGTLGSNQDSFKATFGFTIDYREGDADPRGHLTYQDHTANFWLKADSFDLLVNDGNHAWFTGTGTINDGQTVSFTVEVNALSRLGLADTFSISIPELNGYTAGGDMSGGNITIH